MVDLMENTVSLCAERRNSKRCAAAKMSRLFIAQFDTQAMCVIRSTEQIAVPERGARLGNFSCFIENEQSAYVVAAEWMQSIKGKDWRYCMEFGSDNSIFLSHITKA